MNTRLVSEANWINQRLAELGRRLASTREDLIVLGSDPADLAVPVHPDDDL